MSKSKGRSLTNDFVKGGQITKNEITMFWQNIKMIATPVFLVLGLGALFLFFSTTDEYERYLWWQYIRAEVHYESFQDKTLIDFKYPDGQVGKVKASNVIQSVNVVNAYNNIRWIINALSGCVFVLTIVFFFAIGRFLKYRGSKLGEIQVIDGVMPVDNTQELIDIIERKNKEIGHSPKYSICGVPFYDSSELLHIGVSGSPGQGKTQVLIPLVEQIIINEHKAIIYDKQRAFVKYFYEEGRDVILNPLDERSPAWNIHAEARTATDYDSIFEAMIPMSKNTEPYWTLAARTIASKTALRFRQSGEFRMAPMLEKLYNTSLEDIAIMLKGTEAGALIDAKNPKTGESLRSVMSTYIKCLGYCYDSPVRDPNTGEQSLSRLFSISNWVRDDKRKGMIFITSQGDQHATLIPLITTFFNIAVNSGMSMESDLDRRVFVMLDELPGLNQLPSIARGAAELRQFGFSFVGGWQLYSQLEEVYGAIGAKSIAGLFTNRIQFYAGSEKANVKAAAEQFGTYTVRIPDDSLSIGVGPYRDGANFKFKDEKEECVTEGAIKALPKMHGYIAMAGGAFPVAPFVKDVYVPDVKAEGMKVRDLTELALGNYLVIGNESGATEQLELSDDNLNDSVGEVPILVDSTSNEGHQESHLGKVDGEEDAKTQDKEAKQAVTATVTQAFHKIGATADAKASSANLGAQFETEDGLFDPVAAEKEWDRERQSSGKKDSPSTDDDFDLFY